MPLIRWDERFSVGDEGFDSDHRELVSLVNQLNDALKEGRGMETLDRVLDELAAHARDHFQREEQVMEGAGYPDAAFHRAEHRLLAARAEELHRQYRAGVHAAFSLEVLTFMRDTLVEHIQRADKLLGQFLRSQPER